MKNVKRPKFKNVLAMVVAAVMVATLFTGCSRNSAENNAAKSAAETIQSSTANKKPASWISDTPFEVSIMYADNTGYPYSPDWETLKELTKRTNATLKLQVVPDSDYDKKVKLVLNSGDMPDLVTKMNYANSSEYALNGALLAVSDYNPKLPNMTKLQKDWKLDEELKNNSMPDGKIYAFIGAYESPMPDRTLFIRTDILKKHNLSMPKSTDELYTVLKKLKELYPNSLPLSSQYNLGLLGQVMGPSFDTGAGWLYTSGFKFDHKQDKWIHTASSEEYRNMLRYLYKLQKEGLLDPEAFTQSTAQWEQKIANSTSFVNYQYFVSIPTMEENGRKASNNPDFKLEPVMPLSGPNGGKGYFYPMNRVSFLNLSPSSIAKKPYFESFLKLVDYLYYSQEGIDLFSWGIQGKTYSIENGAKQITKTYKPTPASATLGSFRKDFGLRTNSLLLNRSKEFEYGFFDQVTVEYSKKLAADNLYLPLDKPIKLNNDEKEQEKLLIVPLTDYTNKMTLEFIFGKASLDADWDKYVKECEAKGKNKILDIYNKDWERQKKSLK